MIREEGSRLILSGPMTMDTASALRAAGRPLVAGASREVDLSGVTAVDSAGVAV
ncbi:MAG: STAS domain-containing protein, partial [Zoogloea sp.]|nr:STAS domain-containing protein [Zoogloea sp.]